MTLLSLEHSKLVYRADFAFYGAAVIGLAGSLALGRPAAEWPVLAGLALLGTAGWTLIEYAMHRFVLHGLRPFSAWHALHHQRPTALIASPTLFSASLIAILFVLPAWLLTDAWRAAALTLGLLIGYLGYTITHHATHHWHIESAWLKRRKRAHALHHHLAAPAHFGVTTAFWDRLFGSVPQR